MNIRNNNKSSVILYMSVDNSYNFSYKNMKNNRIEFKKFKVNEVGLVKSLVGVFEMRRKYYMKPIKV